MSLTSYISRYINIIARHLHIPRYIVTKAGPVDVWCWCVLAGAGNREELA